MSVETPVTESVRMSLKPVSFDELSIQLTRMEVCDRPMADVSVGGAGQAPAVVTETATGVNFSYEAPTAET